MYSHPCTLLAGNSWGTDSEGSGLGHGPQEEFYGCADIAITDDPMDSTVTVTSDDDGSGTGQEDETPPPTTAAPTPAPTAAPTAAPGPPSSGCRPTRTYARKFISISTHLSELF